MNTPDYSLPLGYVLQGGTGKYTISQKLGQGAFGITYMAETEVEIHGNMGIGKVSAYVAVKEFFMRDLHLRNMKTGAVEEPVNESLAGKYRTAFLSEARHMAMLSKEGHPNIVQVIEVFETNNTAYIVMQYLRGGSLDEHILSQNGYREQEALPVFLQLCRAVGFMHDHHMLHLDLKPKNVMFDEKGTVKLIDFGLSKQYDENGEAETSTAIGLGTPGYAPNEQAEMRKAGTFPVTIDVYSLGATLYKMLTGAIPPSASDILNDDTLLPVALRNKGVSESVIGVVVKAMTPASKKRYQSVPEMIIALPNKEEETLVIGNVEVPAGNPAAESNEQTGESNQPEPAPAKQATGSSSKLRPILIAAAVGVCVAVAFLLGKNFGNPTGGSTPEGTPAPVVEDTVQKKTPKAKPQPEEKTKPAEKAQKVAAPDPQPAQPTVSRATVDLGYAVWTGEVKQNKPHGEGRMTYKQAHALNDEEGTVAQPGDVVEGVFSNGVPQGVLVLTTSDGRRKTLMM